MGPEVGRLTVCDKCYGEIYESGRMWAKQKKGGASNVWAAQGDADGSRHALPSLLLVLDLRNEFGRGTGECSRRLRLGHGRDARPPVLYLLFLCAFISIGYRAPLRRELSGEAARGGARRMFSVTGQSGFGGAR